VQTGYGFHLVYVDEKKAPHTAAVEEVRDRIVDSLTRNKQARKGETILEELRKNARIKILDYSITDQEYVDFWKDQLAKKEE
jgi:parvulin-like peptidyl-prolyl isomerase